MSKRVHLDTSVAAERASWEGLRDLARILPDGWTLAGGTLVRLLAVERGGRFQRSTTDIDLILDIRAYPRTKELIGPALRRAGFTIPPPPNPAGKDHRWIRPVPGRDGVEASIDILAPSFLGPRIDDTQFPGVGRLLATRGAQFGIDRSEKVTVIVDDEFEVALRRPDVLGALYEKCSALKNIGEFSFDRHYEDIALLVTLLDIDDMESLGTLRRRQLSRIRSGVVQAISSLGVRAPDDLGRLVLVIDSYLPRVR